MTAPPTSTPSPTFSPTSTSGPSTREWSRLVPRVTHIGDLIAAGHTPSSARRAVAGMERLGPGAFAPAAGLSPEQGHRLRAAVVLRRLRQVVASHITAAVLWDLPVRQDDLGMVHVSPLLGRSGGPKSGRMYRLHARAVDPLRTTPPWDLPDPADNLTATDAPTTVADCSRLLGEWGVVIADGALRRGIVSVEQLAAAAAGLRGATGVGHVRALPGLVSALAESPGESLLRLRLRRMGLHVEEQVVLGSGPRAPRVDFLVNGILVVEFDGRSKYAQSGDPMDALWAEKRRQDDLLEMGYLVMRVVWVDLWDEPALNRRVMRTLARRRS